ncbi:GNAT family N-acetyltransferase [Massilia alkalitolerans]|uniref:GNAT family N-acetyltransferase n=1 Tax=Massilia alkalitolerans TaxID=286638 RepID=UPI000420BC5A|nr:GNAT family N-acetyltransferase [Massilia alkalitolerans]
MYLDQFLSPSPVHIGRHHDLDLYAEGQGFALARVRDMLAGDIERYTDLCGRTVGQIMPLLDWRIHQAPYCVTACRGDQVVAAAWAGTVRSKQTGGLGCNISYGVRPEASGKGLATILSALAYQQCVAGAPDLEFVNVQTEAHNLGARAIASRLALLRAPVFDRETACRAPRLYVTYRAHREAVKARCEEILAAAGVVVHWPEGRGPTRSSRSLVQPRIELPPSITALFQLPEGSRMTNSPARSAAATTAPAPAAMPRTDHQVLRDALTGPHGLLPGIALVEHQLEIAKKATPNDAPFPLTPAQANIHHQASFAAYTHSLEMVSSGYIRDMLSEFGPAPAAGASRDAQDRAIADLLFGQCGVVSGLGIIEKYLAQATRADHLDSPFGMDAEDAVIWHRAQASAYQYVLEMLCADRIRQLAPQFTHLLAPPPAETSPSDDDPAPAPGM